MVPKTKIYAGVFLWVFLLFALTGSLWFTTRSDFYKQWEKKVQETIYLLQPENIEIGFPGWVGIAPGDRLFLADDSAEEGRREIGVVYARGECPKTKEYLIQARIYPEFTDLIYENSEFSVMREPNSPRWFVEMLLPLERRKELMNILQRYMEAHINDVKNLLWPVLIEVGQESYQIFRDNFAVIMERHKERLVKKVKDVRKPYIEEELLTLWEEALWPLVLKKGEPVLNPITQKIWDKFPKFHIIWLWMYQSLPGTQNDHVRKRLEEYLRKEVFPIIQENEEELKKLATEVLAEASKDPRMKQTFLNIAEKIVRDEELIEIFTTLLMELFEINKQTLAQKLKAKVETPEFQKRMNMISQDFEPYLMEMVNHLLLQPDRQLRPELAKVLRRQVLFKNRYFIEVRSPKGNSSKTLPKRFVGRSS